MGVEYPVQGNQGQIIQMHRVRPREAYKQGERQEIRTAVQPTDVQT